MDEPPPTDLPLCEFAFPGPLRDQLVASVLAGTKVSTTSTVVEYGVEDEPFPAVGQQSLMIDSGGRGVAVLETTHVAFARFGEVDLRHAVDEGEGFATVQEWAVAHRAYWEGPEVREYLGDPTFTIDDATELVLERFRVVQRLVPDRAT